MTSEYEYIYSIATSMATGAKNEPSHKFSVPKLIAKKRDGGQLTREEIEFFVRSVADNSIEGCQLGISALFKNYLQCN